MKIILQRYKHAWTLLYFAIYLPWFFFLEKTVTTDYYVMHITLDDYIPFNEYFIIPYLLWFLYVAATLIFFFFADKQEYYRLFAFLAIGMTVSLIVCSVFPNGTDLRPVIDPDKNIFTALVSVLWKGDTCTNVFPSVHVFNSLAVHIAIMRSRHLTKQRWIRVSSFVLMTMVCLATVFLKQHSAIDGFASLLLAFVLYQILYSGSYASRGEKAVQKTLGSDIPARIDS